MTTIEHTIDSRFRMIHEMKVSFLKEVLHANWDFDNPEDNFLLNPKSGIAFNQGFWFDKNYDGHPCGTAACLYGNYAFQEIQKENPQVEIGNWDIRIPKDASRLDFHVGTRAFIHQLGVGEYAPTIYELTSNFVGVGSLYNREIKEFKSIDQSVLQRILYTTRLEYLIKVIEYIQEYCRCYHETSMGMFLSTKEMIIEKPSDALRRIYQHSTILQHTFTRFLVVERNTGNLTQQDIEAFESLAIRVVNEALYKFRVFIETGKGV